MKKLIFSIALLFCFPTYQFAQESPGSSTVSQLGNMNLSILHLRPMDELALEGYRPGWGLSMEWLSNDLGRKLPLNLQTGLRFSFSDHGSFRTEVNLVEPIEGQARYDLSNSQSSILGLARLITKDGPVRLYADFQGGFQSYYTSEYYDLIRSGSGNVDYSSDTELNTWGFQYGGAAGLQINLGDDIYLDIRGHYLRGSSARFASLENVSVSENQVVAPLTESNTAQWGIQAGITMKLFKSSNNNEDCDCCDD